MATKILGNYKNNDIELCRTASKKAGDQMAQLLLNAGIPFTRNCNEPSKIRRLLGDKTPRLWIFAVHPRRYSQARKLIDKLDSMYKKRLMFSNY